jgi:hypothetical protein
MWNRKIEGVNVRFLHVAWGIGQGAWGKKLTEPERLALVRSVERNNLLKI